MNKMETMNEKDSLIDLLIHDLTGPLAIVSTSVNSLLSKEERCGAISERQRQTLERISRNTDKARNLLQEMIELYRSKEGLFRCEDVSIGEILHDTLVDAIEIIDPPLGDSLARAAGSDEFDRLLRDKGIICEVSGKYCTSPFRHDRKKIQQILRNLLTNALKYRKEKVLLSIKGDGDLVISVEDDGAGIPKEKQGYIFKRFFQQKNGIKPAAEGLGFGLSCVKTLVEAMQGEITLESGEGNGTRFTVRVPAL
jgi:two-component system, OmpR family, phosphate regulon sensor histidine kinase PhoR